MDLRVKHIVRIIALAAIILFFVPMFSVSCAYKTEYITPKEATIGFEEKVEHSLSMLGMKSNELEDPDDDFSALVVNGMKGRTYMVFGLIAPLWILLLGLAEKKLKNHKLFKLYSLGSIVLLIINAICYCEYKNWICDYVDNFGEYGDNYIVDINPMTTFYIALIVLAIEGFIFIRLYRGSLDFESSAASIYKFEENVVQSIIEEKETTEFCSKCGEKLTKEDKFCPQCGNGASNNKKEYTPDEIKKKVKSFIPLAVILLIIAFVWGCVNYRKHIVDFEELSTCKATGYDGYGEMSSKSVLDTPQVYNKYKEIIDKKYDRDEFLKSISYKYSKSKGLKNGNKISVTCVYDKYLAKKLGLHIRNATFDYKVTDLDGVSKVDPFENDVKVTFTGFGDDITAEVTTPDSCVEYSWLEFGETNGLKNGDKFKVTIKKKRTYGIVFTRTSKIFTVKSEDACINSIQEVSDKAKRAIAKSNSASDEDGAVLKGYELVKDEDGMTYLGAVYYTPETDYSYAEYKMNLYEVFTRKGKIKYSESINWLGGTLSYDNESLDELRNEYKEDGYTFIETSVQ